MFSGVNDMEDYQNIDQSKDSLVGHSGDVSDNRELNDNTTDQQADVARGRKETSSIEELFFRVQDSEERIMVGESKNVNDIPIPLLSDTATLAEVIKTVNLLIKQELTFNRLK